jgi:hypothetical protein
MPGAQSTQHQFRWLIRRDVPVQRGPDWREHDVPGFAETAPTYFYQFDHLHAPGLNNDLPSYQWGAGHAMKLAYRWPSFGNGFSL